MKKTGFYKKEWFVSLVASLLFMLAVFSGNPTLERLESLAYDAGVRMTHRSAGATDSLAIVAIDEASIKEIGRWPWPRSVLAEMVESLARAEAKAVGLLIFLTEPQTDPGLGYIRILKSYLESSPFPRNAQAQSQEIRQILEQAEKEIDTDAQLERVLSSERNVYMPMFFQMGKPIGKPDSPLPEYISRNRLTTSNETAGSNHTEQTLSVGIPLEQFGKHTAGIGHLNLGADTAEGVRTERLVLEHYGEYYPSLSLLLAARSLNLGPQNIQVALGDGVKLGRLNIKTNNSMQMYTGFYPRTLENAFPIHSFLDVRAGKVAPASFKNKIVLIGSTAVGVGSTYSTPIDTLSSPELVANFIASILNQDFYTRPDWAPWVEMFLFALIVFYLMLAIPRLSAKVAALITLLVLATLVGGGQFLMVSEKLWLRTVSPALLLMFGHVLVSSMRFFLTERLKVEAETDSAQTNRMLGLAFQSQGQLDMALDKFRRLPIDETVLELFYNLALDFERKRQFSKAGNCYDSILKHEPKYRDVAVRKQRAVSAEQTVILGGKNVSGGGTMILDGGGQKPTLGRYEIEKELGKGAMGTVYLGRDPRINRVVAIKTMALSQEFEANELAAVRERFFREAETAGRLNHPSIVTIFDAGEEHDLAYIAMEFLEGKDLTSYVTPDKKLPVGWVVHIVADVADALDYAHKNGVVHRDIKPANIMYNTATNSIKVTDFGIARITASSKTKTGMVLGTPSYMSPEQLAGKHVDGRSDLFSLGVMLFEMLSGQQPFVGDSLATLMYQIATGEHPNLLAVRPDLPPCLKPLIDRALDKNPDARFQTGADLRQALLDCVPTAANTGASAP